MIQINVDRFQNAHNERCNAKVGLFGRNMNYTTVFYFKAAKWINSN